MAASVCDVLKHASSAVIFSIYI